MKINKNKTGYLDLQLKGKTISASGKLSGNTDMMPPELKSYFKNFNPLVLSNVCCENCTNYAGGCEWSNSLEPVPGWYAKEFIRNTEHGQESYYKILFCPKFKYDKKCKDSKYV